MVYFNIRVWKVLHKGKSLFSNVNSKPLFITKARNFLDPIEQGEWRAVHTFLRNPCTRPASRGRSSSWSSGSIVGLSPRAGSQSPRWSSPFSCSCRGWPARLAPYPPTGCSGICRPSIPPPCPLQNQTKTLTWEKAHSAF